MTIRKLFKVEMAHRLVDSYSKKCQSIHGHSYLIEIVLAGEPTEEHAQMVMDFGELKDKFKDFIDAFDHSMVVYAQDPMYPKLKEIMDELNMRYIVVPYNPTAEMMSAHILQQAMKIGLPVHKVRVHETTTGWAESKRSRDNGVEVDLSKVYFSEATGFVDDYDNGRLL